MSLLPLAGMFIFGGKKKEEEDIYAKLARKYGLTRDQVRKIGFLIVRGTRNIPKLLKRVDPEQDEKRIHKVLEAVKHVDDTGEPYIYKEHGIP
ncbi:hypothetical protein [Thermococcus barophilus]|uniref:Uncharacterized protein n=1 Tax=Thermococcus barophilus (strain DSM 11836 / MP) TaxID=391623 RepID=F0LKF2_THEBM|nr:hypothetical protein [Thermococcus barophilus]ADT83610.1 hypothetical protein TERMP_00633 [Thermococcus barophilus MP]